MTIEEIKDLIDNTINENGTKAITGKALNLALNEITNAVAEAATTGGGGGVKRMYVDLGGAVTDPEQLASNAALYTEIVTALTNDKLPPQVGVLLANGGTYAIIISTYMEYLNPGIMFSFSAGNSQSVISLTSDGNVQFGG